MVKRQPLRKRQPDARFARQAAGGGSSSSKPGAAGKKKTSKPSADDEDAYWARIEAEQTHKREREGEEDSNDDEESDDDSDSSSDESEEGISLNQKVEHVSEQYTFEFNDMREAFTEGITTLLRAHFVANPTAAYDVACSISEQTAVGTAIVCEGGDDVFAFATVLPLARHNKGALNNTLTQVATHLKASTAAAKSDNAKMMLSCIQGAQQDATGLLVHHRFANLPPQLVGHLHRNLNEDLGWAQGRSENVDGSGDGSSAEDHSLFKAVEYILIIAPCIANAAAGGASSSSSSSSSGNKKKGNKKQKTEAEKEMEPHRDSIMDVTGSTAVIFDNFEDEVYFQEASCSFLFTPKDSTHGTPVTISLLPTSAMQAVVKGISSLIPVDDE